MSPARDYPDTDRNAHLRLRRTTGDDRALRGGDAVVAELSDDRVFDRVRACLDNLVGGSGHLTSYRLDRESFVVHEHRPLDDDRTEYAFAVDGVRTSEFDDAVPPRDTDPAGDDEVTFERLRGRIVLDADGGLVTDDAGRVRLAPWRTLDPAFWADDEHGDGLDSLLADLDRTTE